eukprot:TRINITY_DN4682_c0_g1_i2.p1 TRINITY_DN4682_c0_g1~~TRINITY_DN4682_c0_g1_i2.p1  ORF type:complete len:101 (-),score=7.27 TRINITY_DN4682_c0_g1_i2:143-445(-)
MCIRDRVRTGDEEDVGHEFALAMARLREKRGETQVGQPSARLKTKRRDAVCITDMVEHRRLLGWKDRGFGPVLLAMRLSLVRDGRITEGGGDRCRERTTI